MIKKEMKHRNQILFLSHGGGPMPLLGDAGHHEMVECLKGIAKELRKPSAIVVISAHWEENVATLTAGTKPALFYDYYGFPEKSYHIAYPCPGEPQLAKEISELLMTSGIPSKLDEKRGFDHGMFVPLKIMYPDAEIPVVQLSLIHSLNAEEHLKIGEALHTLEYKNLLIIGSGFSFHNLQKFFATDTEATREKNESFENWLRETCSTPDMDEKSRYQRLVRWEEAPAARFCHPREEHLLPLHICYGMAQRASTRCHELTIMGKKASMYLWT